MWNPYVIIEWLVEARWLSDDILILEPHRPNITNKCPGIEGPFIFINHISDDTIHIRRYIDPEYVCNATDWMTCSTTQKNSSSESPSFFWGNSMGWGPGGIEEAEGQTLSDRFAKKPQKQGLGWEKSAGKGVSFDIFVEHTWCTWQPAIESGKMYEDDKMHD